LVGDYSVEGEGDMSWARILKVNSGTVMLRTAGEADGFTLEGQLECSEGFRVYFRQVQYSQARAEAAGIVTGCATAEIEGTARIEARGLSLPPQPPQTTTFLGFCQQLLVEGARLPDHYTFYADLYLGPEGRLLPVVINDTYHPRSFVEFAHTGAQPFVLIRHRAQDSYPGRDELESACTVRWPTPGTE
jgi:hypothetical protein